MAFAGIWAELRKRVRQHARGVCQQHPWAASRRGIESLIADLESADRPMTSRDVVAVESPTASTLEQGPADEGHACYVHSFDTECGDLKRYGHVLQLNEHNGSLLIVAAQSALENVPHPTARAQAQIDGSWASDLWWSLRALVWVAAAQVDGMVLPARVFDRLEALGALPVVMPAVVVAAGVALAFRDLEKHARVTLCLAIYLLVSSLALTLAGRHLLVFLLRVPPHLNPHLSYRHRAFPNAALLLAVAAIVDGARRSRTRVVAAVVACLGLVFAWGPEFRLEPFPDLQWPLWAARLEAKLASGSREPLVIPSYPQLGFQIVIDGASSGSGSPATAADRQRMSPGR